MPEPIVFISHFRVRDGSGDRLTALTSEIVAQLQADKPQTLVYASYLDEERNEVSFVHVFGDAEALDRHFEGADQRSAAAYELIQPAGWQIYGRPSAAALDSIRRAAQASAVPLTFQPVFAGGFVRLDGRE